MKIGDELFQVNRYWGLTKVKVTKITPKNSIRLSNGDLLNSDLSLKTRDTWNNSYYLPVSDELELKYKEQQVKNKLSSLIQNIEISAMSLNKAIEMIKLLEKED